MLKRGKVIILALTALLALAGTAAAENREGAFTISPVVGGYLFDGTQHLKFSAMPGIRFGYNFTSNLGVEAFFDYAATEGTGHNTAIGPGASVNMYHYGGDMLYHFMPEKKLVPYLAAGYGGINIEPANSRGIAKGVFDWGVGLKYFVTEDLALRTDFRQLFYKNPDTLYNYLFDVGVTFNFGGKKPAVKAAAAPSPPPPAPAPAPVAEPEPLVVPAAEPTPEKMKYCITMDIEFTIDSDAIRDQYKPEVARVADFMKKYPDTTAVIEGHTDNVGTAEYNLALSQRRADSVMKSLVQDFGIDQSRLTAKGYGLTRPIAPNTTDAGRAKNRRTDAIIDCAMVPKGTLDELPEQLCMVLMVDFDSNSAVVKPEYDKELAKLADFMKQYPTVTATIAGHTDNVGSREGNMKLSQKRAEAVVKYLEQKFGIAADRLTAKGYGDTRPIAYNTTPEGRTQNRRITAVVDCVIKKK